MPELMKIGETIDLYHGEAFRVLQSLPDDSVDAIITDPPYSSGGFTRSDRTGDPASKYVQTGTLIDRPSFSGDNRDQRSYLAWCTLWMSEALRVLKPSGYALIFTDWRQLPITTDALQCGGFVWRGVVSWDKTEASRPPHTGYFRHQCEFIVWGTKGVSVPCQHGGPWPGCIRVPVRQADKLHITGKPTDLLRQLVQVAPPGGIVLDPFMGSGTTGHACEIEGRRFIGSEMNAGYFEVATKRIQRAQEHHQPGLFLEEPQGEGEEVEP